MFFITRLTENTNLAASIPPSEQIFNAARINIMLARPKFAELDIAAKPRQSAGPTGSMQGVAEEWAGAGETAIG
jgi:Ras-related GTP-binding protein A/B